MQVTRTARMMIETLGFSKTLGQLAFGSGGGGPSFLGAEAGQASDFSQKTRDTIDSEVRLRSVCVIGLVLMLDNAVAALQLATGCFESGSARHGA